MLLKALLLLLPAVALARINIRIKASSNDQNAAVEYVGTNIEIISDKERHTFGIGDEPLKDAVRAFAGGRPSDAYVKSPTPWNDLFARYGWPQVQRILTPVRARIIGIRSEPTIVATREFINNSSVKATYNTGITQSIDETVSNTWSKSFQLSVNQEISYSVEFAVGEVGGSTSFGFTSGWGEDVTKSKSVTVGSSNGVTVQLDPGQSVLASLTASRGTMEIEVEYRATLDGYVACNYPGKLRGHYFWGFDINQVLDAAGREKEKVSKEVIKIGFYTDAKVIVNDPRTKRGVPYYQAE